ncbi:MULTISPECIES: GNAT family N-acetyltransferase [unclassified Actinomyces]|uniref:lipid II:glycine glycyltransferase FemX n=1 Tax=unclassified Actinomyces TaxID=2609248 RepID=UPI00201730DA|nr:MULTISPECIES: GNAT family N-acetyltransferase [unclassified Actinomyces]MCL3778359.1 GNAT family N-acetyltransferase [Actinomyces sp. AC-20-1]MCL3789947.1 GNAT family N-acetyltransferase [Actinomyces sp. 187325]MCL3792174.1 GNAT family N-acetyltransferase [Actinomyces sp. 186855]MCL3794331.1 GNAT family N-acetyltransferase [Actinomyces sp. 217892]
MRPASTEASRSGEPTAVLRPVNARDARIAVGCTPCPLEQLEVWQAFEASQGHELFGRYLYECEGKPTAVISLYRYTIGGRPFLWAKHGPVWLKEQTPEREADLRRRLIAAVRARDPRVVFIRMHARFHAPDTHELISTITYDRTYVIDLRPGTPEAISEAMPKDGRRGVRRAERTAREAGCTIAEETGLDRAAFEELYAVLEETAQRDGFRPHPSQVYWDMLTTLGPEHARVFVLRKDGAPHCWDLVTVSGKTATAYYGASSNASRGFRGAEALDWAVACAMAAEGRTGLDLMGAESTRVPELYSVGRYKRRFAQHPTEVDGAWDVLVRPVVYRALVQARRARHALRHRLGA